jgi:branched-chain amino acid transport system ATP-binding protein
MICRLRDESITILLAQQNARKAISVADRGYVVAVTTAGSARTLLMSPNIASRYLGWGNATEISLWENIRVSERSRACFL